MTITLEQINKAPDSEGAALLAGLYEHSPWVVQRALEDKPFASLAQLKHALAHAVHHAEPAEKLALLRAHPELAGKAIVAGDLTAESSHEQSTAGLTHCTPAELAQLHALNADYQARFGFPFILAVRGPRGNGLSKRQIIAEFERRSRNHANFELEECLRNVNRIAELRLNDKLNKHPNLGNHVWDGLEQLATHSDSGYAELGQLTVTYLTDAHRACAALIAQTMRDSGFDSVNIDAVGNVVGVYNAAAEPGASPKTLLTGSHFDTVRNGGKHDGRLGIYVPIVCVRELHRMGQRLPFNIEVVGFAEEEGQRYKATFLGSGALVGDFKPEWLDQKDADGITMRSAMLHAGLDAGNISAIQRDPTSYLGFVEVHIEQGPVLNELDIPLGIVTSINGSVRYLCEITGMASHAGTTPMNRRRDAACAAAELALYIEKRAAEDGDAVGTMGMLQVPGGSINVVPGRCLFSLDMRAPLDAQRDALASDVLTQLQAICERRSVHHTLELTEKAAAAPSASEWQQRWENAVTALGVPIHRMPSGAGHDAMKIHKIMPQAMLFVRGQNSGISHNPLESTTSDDIELSIEAFMHLLLNLGTTGPTAPAATPNQ